MDRRLLDKFLSGTTTEAERQMVETLLNQTGTVIDDVLPDDCDSVIEAIRRGTAKAHDVVGSDPDHGVQRQEDLIERIESLIPRQAIGKDELEQVLDPPEQEDELGRIGRFRVVELIACGGMGLVFKAADPKLDRDVCIKIMNPALASRAEAKQRFERESRAAARLQNKRIVAILEVGEHRQLPFLVMPLLEGESLRRRLQRHKKLDYDEALRIAIMVAEGLRYVHAQGYLHRDIKPDNIWLTSDDDVILLDLGLVHTSDGAEITHCGAVLGTPCYMSPEQVQGKPLNATSDLFSLGTVLFEMLTGISPFDRANVFSTMMSVANDTLPLPFETADNAIPDALVPILRRLLAKDPAARPQLAEEAIELLETARGGARQIGGTPAPEGSRGTVSPTRRSIGWPSKLRYAIAGAIAAALIGWAAWLVYVKTDKGTLVVRADPSVEATLADDSVKLREPQSGKEYTVRIGAQPLPSGVYQLELEDADQHLVFSSTVITIRRGKTELVRVELRDSAGTAGKVGVEPAATPVKTDNVRFRFSDLKPLDTQATRRAIGWEPGKPPPARADVHSPPMLPGVDAWSVLPDRPYTDVALLSLSPDGKRIASRVLKMQTNTGSTIYIWNDSFTLTHLLPFVGRDATVHWSPAPDVLAVLSKGDRPQATIWRLCDSHAEVLQVIPIAAARMTWSPRGDRIAFETSQGILFYRLADQQTYSIRGNSIRGSLGEWSSDGRLLTTIENDTVLVWSVESGMLINRFSKAKSPRWLRTGGLLIQRTDGEQTWREVWDVETQVRKGFCALSPDWYAGTFANDDRFERFAAIGQNWQLVTGAIHGAADELKLSVPSEPMVVPKNPSRRSRSKLQTPWLEMADDGRMILLIHGTYATLLRVKDTGKPAIVAPWTNLGQLPPPSSFPEAYRSSRVLVDRTRRNTDDSTITLSAQPFDLHRLKPISAAQTMTWSPDDNETGGVRPSPLGTYMALVSGVVNVDDRADETGEKRTFKASSNCRIILAATGELFHEFEMDAYVQHLEWSDDERFLVITSSNGADRREEWVGRIHILDVKNKALNELRLEPKLNVWYQTGDAVAARRAELRGQPTHLFSKITGKQLWVVVPDQTIPAVDKLIPQRLGRSAYDHVYHYSVKSYELETGTPLDSQSMGYFYRNLANIDIAGDWIIWRGLPVSDAPVAQLSDAGSSSKVEQTPRQESRWHKFPFGAYRQVHVMSLSSGLRKSLDTTYDAPSSPLMIRHETDSSPAMSLSSGGQYLCAFTPENSRWDSAFHVLATETIDAIRTPNDAEYVVRLNDPGRADWDSPDRPIWHYAKPILAWHQWTTTRKHSAQRKSFVTVVESDGVRWYNAQNKKVCSFKGFCGEVLSIRSIEFGWIVQDACSLLAFDHQGNYLGRWLDGARPDSRRTESQINCWIDATGRVKTVLSQPGLSVVSLQANRIRATAFKEFQAKFADHLPVAADPFE